MPRGTTAAKTTADQPTLDEEKWDSFEDTWDEVGNDNGEIISFEKGTVMFGVFSALHSIELPEDKRQVKDGVTQTHADLLIFQYPDSKEKWSMWKTYQVGEALENVDEPEGKLFRIECQGTRKASQGEVKVFSVKVRTNR